MNLYLKRQLSGAKQTLGKLQVIDVCGEVVFECYTLELPWRNNKSNVSCIPEGTYHVRRYASPSKGQVFLLEDVPGRSYIEIHAGNFYTDIEGCILVGDDLSDINADGFQDVLNSRKTLFKLLEIMPDEFEITIQ